MTSSRQSGQTNGACAFDAKYAVTISPVSFRLAQSMGKNVRPFFHDGREADECRAGPVLCIGLLTLQPPENAEKRLDWPDDPIINNHNRLWKMLTRPLQDVVLWALPPTGWGTPSTLAELSSSQIELNNHVTRWSGFEESEHSQMLFFCVLI